MAFVTLQLVFCSDCLAGVRRSKEEGLGEPMLLPHDIPDGQKLSSLTQNTSETVGLCLLSTSEIKLSVAPVLPLVMEVTCMCCNGPNEDDDLVFG